jgi:hypothetical protein
LDQLSKSPGLQGELVGNTCNAIIADDNAFEAIFQSF